METLLHDLQHRFWVSVWGWGLWPALYLMDVLWMDLPLMVVVLLVILNGMHVGILLEQWWMLSRLKRLAAELTRYGYGDEGDIYEPHPHPHDPV